MGVGVARIGVGKEGVGVWSDGVCAAHIWIMQSNTCRQECTGNKINTKPRMRLQQQYATIIRIII